MKAEEEVLRAVDEVLAGRATTRRAERPLMTSKAAAARALAVSRTTLWRMEKQGVLAAVELYPGGPKRFRTSDIERLVATAVEGRRDD